MEFNPHHFQHIKLALHIAQLVIIFVAWVIEIAVFRSSADIDGRAGWYFGLVCAVPPPRTIFTSYDTDLFAFDLNIEPSSPMTNVPMRSASSPSRLSSTRP